ncbi:MAG: phage tail sheath family protein [Chitinophagales bacterium]
MAQVYTTPGVYIQEKNSFPNSIVAVETAVPAFVGYTEKAAVGTKSLLNQAIRITSFAEFLNYYGGAPKTTYTIESNEETIFDLKVDTDTQFFLYYSVKMFYANGGATCYIVSVGDYNKGIHLTDLNGDENEGGLQSLVKEINPTLVVIPDAVLLSAAECYALQRAMIHHCGVKMGSRMAILDVHGGSQKYTLEGEEVIEQFRTNVDADVMDFAASYYPWLNCNVVDFKNIDYTNISNHEELATILIKEADALFAKGTMEIERTELAKATIQKMQEECEDKGGSRSVIHQTLLPVIPCYEDIMKAIYMANNVLPPSGIMAGIYSQVDATRGVFQSPANVSLNLVVSPTVSISDAEQEDLNVPLNGKAVNAIRSFAGRGVLVWGARTMKGNSQDWRYISVRRTIIMIEQSIKFAMKAYVFEPNTAATWMSVKAMIDNFLNNLWKQGGLAGTSPTEAFEINVGLGTTMTPTNRLDDIMLVSAKLALTRPAEYIVLTFKQKMQQS